MEMEAIEVLNLMTHYARAYRVKSQNRLPENNHMSEIEGGEVVQQRHIDAVLVDFINYVGVCYGVDYALYTSDIKTEQDTI